MFGKIAVVTGLVAVLWALIMSIGIVPHGALFAITPNGAMDGAMTFFLAALALFAWPAEAPPAPPPTAGD
jgi:hypothetical protein